MKKLLLILTLIPLAVWACFTPDRAEVLALEHPDMKKVYDLMNAVQYEIMANRFEDLARRLSGLTPSSEL